MGHILLLSYYYPPDLSAGSFRSSALTKALKDLGDDRLSIDVITTKPNRYRSFPTSVADADNSDGIHVIRAHVPDHGGGFTEQALAFRHYARAVWRFTRGKHYDLVFATSSRMMTAMLAAFIARRLGSPLYLDIRDIFAEIMPEMVRPSAAFLIRPILLLSERWTINRADYINLISPGFNSWFEQRYPGRTYFHHTNGVDPDFIRLIPESSTMTGGAVPLRVIFAGNIGEGQGLHRIVPDLAKRMEDRAHFIIIGDGGRINLLKELSAGLSNIEIIPPVKREYLADIYKSADVLFVHLNDYPALKRVIPSKLFEYAATGKPIWAGVSGYAAEFIKKHIDNAAVFPPCNVEAGIQALETLRMETRDRRVFIENYNRDCIMRKMAQEIHELAMVNS